MGDCNGEIVPFVQLGFRNSLSGGSHWSEKPDHGMSENPVLERSVMIFLFGKGSGGVEECWGYFLVLGETYVCI